MSVGPRPITALIGRQRHRQRIRLFWIETRLL